MKKLAIIVLFFLFALSSIAAVELPEKFSLCTLVKNGRIYIKTQACTQSPAHCANQALIHEFSFIEEEINRSAEPEIYRSDILMALEKSQIQNGCHFLSLQVSRVSEIFGSIDEVRSFLEARPFSDWTSFGSGFFDQP